jgi:BirA family biotin operon repressor/biotin-[acetyl-CoA-carboxylase] ligase
MMPAPHPLDIDCVRRGVRGSIGRQLIYVSETGSTNADMLSLPPQQKTHGTIFVTDFQTCGRGRLNRVWTAPPGSSLLLSVLLDWPGDVPLTQSVMLAALSVQDAIRAQTGLRPTLKWPNDVLLRGKKVCGILGESARSPDQSKVVLGIGVNVNVDPAQVPGLPDSATSVAMAFGAPVPRESVLLALVDAMEMWYRCLTGRPTAVFATWSSRLELAGKPVTIRDMTGDWDATALSVQPDGGLLVRTRDGQEELVFAADVSLRYPPPGGFTTQ